MKIIGLTGGIGSGKSTVCKIFEVLDVPVFYADTVGKQLMSSDQDVKNEVIQLFGPQSYMDGQLNRQYIANIVFEDESMLRKLNSIIHPAVRKAGQQWANDNADKTYGIQEVAILFESGAYRFVDRVINVWAPKEMRIDRVMKRDGVSRDQVLDRMSHQISDSLRLSMSDYVIENDGQALIPQVTRIHQKLMS